MNADISEWIRLAEMDLATARHMFYTSYPKPLEIVCFHSQQTAEKMLKAYLVSQGIEPPKIHDMRKLCEMCLEIEKNLEEIFIEAVLLTRYAVGLRYPAELELIESDAEKAIEYAEKVMSFVKTIFHQNNV